MKDCVAKEQARDQIATATPPPETVDLGGETVGRIAIVNPATTLDDIRLVLRSGQSVAAH